MESPREHSFSNSTVYELDLPPIPLTRAYPPDYRKIVSSTECSQSSKYATIDSDIHRTLPPRSESDRNSKTELVNSTSSSQSSRKGEAVHACRHIGIKLKILCAVLVMVVITTAVVGIILGIIGIENECECSTMNHEIKELRNVVTALRMEVNQLSSPLLATLSDIQIHSGCTMTVAAMCTVAINPTSPGFSLCETTSIPISSTDSYTVDVHCARMGSDSEANPIVATLQVDDSVGMMRCQCYVIESDVLPRVQEISCGLFTTRCPFTQNLNTNISYGVTP